MSFLLDADICSTHLQFGGKISNRFLQYTGRLHVSTITLGDLHAWRETGIMSDEPRSLYTFQDLLRPLERTREAKKLAMMSGQVKIERDLLAEIMYNGNRRLSKQLDFHLEEERRDLTVRRLQPGLSRGPLVEWVEAKMCYTDCLARWRTDRPRPEEYRELLRADAKKQSGGIKKLGKADQDALLTSVLFAIHYDQPPPRWKYDRDRKRCKPAQVGKIEQYARDYVRQEIARTIGRSVVEDFTILLDKNCHLHVFVLREKQSAVQGRS